jgi:hypothetical protein
VRTALRVCLPLLWLVTVMACGGERQSAGGRQAFPDSVLARERQTNDSLLRAALDVEGARLEYRWVVGIDSAPRPEHTALFDPVMRRWLILNDTVALDLSQVDGVDVGSGTAGTPVMLHLPMESADRFLSSTTRHVGSHLAVVLNGHLLVAPAPVVKTPLGSSIIVVENVDSAVARELVERLHAALPVSRRH